MKPQPKYKWEKHFDETKRQIEKDKEPQHTPTPWEIYDTRKTHEKGKIFITGQAYMLTEFPALPESEANAKFIVRAVNSHEANEKKIERLLDAVRFALKLAEADYDDSKVKKRPQAVIDAMFLTVKEFKEAIAQAEGK